MLIQINDSMVIDYTNQKETFSDNNRFGSSGRGWGGGHFTNCGNRTFSNGRCNNAGENPNMQCNPHAVDRFMSNKDLHTNNGDSLENRLNQGLVNDIVDSESLDKESVKALFDGCNNSPKENMIDLKALKERVRLQAIHYPEVSEEEEGDFESNEIFMEDREMFISRVRMFVKECVGRNVKTLETMYGDRFTHNVINTLTTEAYMFSNEDDTFGICDELKIDSMKEVEKDVFYLRFLEISNMR